MTTCPSRNVQKSSRLSNWSRNLFRDPKFPEPSPTASHLPISIPSVRRCPMISSAVYRVRVIASSCSGQRAALHRWPGLQGEGHTLDHPRPTLVPMTPRGVLLHHNILSLPGKGMRAIGILWLIWSFKIILKGCRKLLANVGVKYQAVSER